MIVGTLLKMAIGAGISKVISNALEPGLPAKTRKPSTSAVVTARGVVGKRKLAPAAKPRKAAVPAEARKRPARPSKRPKG